MNHSLFITVVLHSSHSLIVFVGTAADPNVCSDFWSGAYWLVLSTHTRHLHFPKGTRYVPGRVDIGTSTLDVIYIPPYGKGQSVCAIVY